MPESMKVVIKIDIHDEKDRRKALKSVSGLSGVESLAIDLKDQKLTIIGEIDAIAAVKKLKKWHTNLHTVGPAKEPKKKDDEAAKKKKEEEEEYIRRLIEACGYWGYNTYPPQRFCLHPVEEYSTGCVIC